MTRKKLPPEARRRADVAKEVARHDMAIGLAGIFRPLRDGAARKEIVLTQRWAGGTVILRGVELGERDLAVLLALLAIALRSDLVPGRGDLVPALRTAGGASDMDVVTVYTSLSDVCREAGVDPDSHGGRHSVRVAIDRLMMIIVRAESASGWRSTQLIGGAIGRGRDAVEITLCYRLTRAVLGTGSYAPICMRDYRALPGGLARIVHVWLTAWMCGASERRISINALMPHIYGPAASPRTARHRRLRLRAAIEAQQACGWCVEWYGDTVTIRRHAPAGPETGPALPRGSRGRRRNRLIQRRNLRICRAPGKQYKYHYQWCRAGH
ncbi:MAG: replication protein C, IncQ-type, partial [Acidiferrobacteraceae bacterium]